jgi:phosphate transport system permease protein
LRFFQHVPLLDFLFGLKWSPQIAIRADQVGSSGAFGAVPLFTGTLLIALIAMLVAVPIGLFSAIYLAEYAPPAIRHLAKPVLEILAGIPTVVYGFFAALTVAPLIVRYSGMLGLHASSESALAAGLMQQAARVSQRTGFFHLGQPRRGWQDRADIPESHRCADA